MNEIEYAIKNRVLIKANIELTNQCNWRCKHCYIDDYSKKGLSYERVCGLLNELKSIGINELLFTGGEVFCRKDILDIIKTARDLGFVVNIFSNISLLNEDMIGKLKYYNVSAVSCTVFSLKEKTHDSITGVEGSLSKTLKNLNLLIKLGVNVEVKTIILNDNYNDYEEVHDYFSRQGISFRSTALISPKVNGDSVSKKCELSYDRVKQLIGKIDKLNDINLEHGFDLDDYMCHEPRYSISIGASGEIYPCLNFRMVIGHVDDGIMNVWDSDRLKYIQNLKNKDLKKCCSCPERNNCIRCAGTAYLENNDILDCSPSDGFFARARLGAKSEKVY